MSELHSFLFEGMPVRGQLVRLGPAWQEILQRRASNAQTGAFPPAVQNLLGEMTAAALLMQSLLKFDGDLILQIFGDGPVKLAVVEVKPDLGVRATAKTMGELPVDASLSQMVNVNNQGKCAITLDPKTRFPGQQPYQGVVPLFDDDGQRIERLSDVLAHYMLQSEQLDTKLILAANDQVAAGLLVQRMPVLGQGNLSAQSLQADEDQIGVNEDFNRIAMLAATLTAKELLTLAPEAILHRLFWDEPLLRFEPLRDEQAPRFACNCSRQRVGQMILGLGQEEANSILADESNIEVGCDFCGRQYHFDAIDVQDIFTPLTLKGDPTPGHEQLH